MLTEKLRRMWQQIPWGLTITCIVFILLIILLLSNIVTLLLTNLTQVVCKDAYAEGNSCYPGEFEELTYDNITFYSRRSWGAVPPKKRLEPVDGPFENIIVKQTCRGNCTTFHECSTLLKAMQTEHMQIDQYNDIRFNFLIGGDAAVYHGRGWRFKSNDSLQCSPRSLTIAVIGPCKGDPTERQKLALKMLILYGIELERILNVQSKCTDKWAVTFMESIR